jgi:hypothetical protein
MRRLDCVGQGGENIPCALRTLPGATYVWLEERAEPVPQASLREAAIAVSIAGGKLKMSLLKIGRPATLCPSACLAVVLSPALSAVAQTFIGSADLDQIRNGSASSPVSPANWVNGNAGQSNAHYIEGYSVAYRCVITGASLNEHTLDIEWDITHSNKHALDYITNFNRLQPHSPFQHAGGCGPGCAEVIDPTIGVAGPLAGPTTFPIPAPSSAGSPVPGQPTASFNSLPANERAVSIWNGTITNIQYLSEGDLADGSSSSSARITFTANAPTVIIAWGGHIATSTDWGAGNSAAQISGSPYHTRLLGLDGGGGNQDRSLSANAVIFPPSCTISGPSVVCPNSNNTWCAPPVLGQTYLWSVTSNCGASIIGSNTGNCVQVQSCSTCDSSFSVNLTVTNESGDTQCSESIDVEDHDDPVFVNCPPDQTIECGTNLPPCATVTATDACAGTITASCQTGDFIANPNGCGGTVTRTYTATDSCQNSATCTQTFTIVDTTPPNFTAPGPQTFECVSQVPPCPTLSATDSCDTSVAVNCATGPLVGGPCGGTVTRTFTATDDCGNSLVRTQVFTMNDHSAPVIVGCPQDATIQCPSDLPPCPAITAADNCGAVLPVSCSDGPLVGGSCPGTITRTFTATDACGNTGSCTQTFTVSDTTDPVINSCPDDISVPCGVPIPPCEVSLDAFDNCTAIEDLVVMCQDIPSGGEGAPSGGGCAGGLTRIYTVQDECGNSALCEQQIFVEPDEIDPFFIDPVPTLDVCLGLPAFIPTPEVGDNCDPAPTVICTRSDGQPCTDPYFPPGLTNVTFTVTDACGNSASVTIPVNPGCCDVEFRTFNQSYWGGDAALSRIQTLLSAPYGDLVIGKPGTNPAPCSARCKKPAAQAIVTRLPAGSTARKFPNELGNAVISASTLNTNPALPLRDDGTFKNVLLGQTIALALNLRNDLENEDGTLGYVALAPSMVTQKPDGTQTTWTIPQAVLDAMLENNLSVTINDLLELANRALAGRNVAPATLAQINTAVSRVNSMFAGSRLLLDCNCAIGTAAAANASPRDDSLGDLNGDGVVDVTDLLGLLDDMGRSADDADADVNGDGTTDTRDLIDLLGNWGTHVP